MKTNAISNLNKFNSPRFGVQNTNRDLLEELVTQQTITNQGIQDLVAFQKKAEKRAKNKPGWAKRMVTERIPSAAVIASVFVAVRYAFHTFLGI